MATEWRLSDHRGKVVVLLFYPGDETPVCTRQMCSVRDRWDDYLATGAEVVGIRPTQSSRTRNFAAASRSAVAIVVGFGRAVAKLYGRDR